MAAAFSFSLYIGIITSESLVVAGIAGCDWSVVMVLIVLTSTSQCAEMADTPQTSRSAEGLKRHR